jgi:hypothetical protein
MMIVNDKLVRYHGVRANVCSDSPSSKDYWAPNSDPKVMAERIDRIMANRAPCTEAHHAMMAFARGVAR